MRLKVNWFAIEKIYYLLGIYIYIWYEFGQTVAVTSKSHKFVFQHDEEEDY